jgi:hypothetical protein
MAVATACGGGSSTGPHDDEDPTGILQLELIEQIPLPVRIYQGPWTDWRTGRDINVYVVNVNGGTLELADDGSFEMLFDMWYSRDGQTETSERRIHGRYEIYGSEITFTVPNSGDTYGTIDRGAVRVSLNVGGTGNFYTYSFGR